MRMTIISRTGATAIATAVLLAAPALAQERDQEDKQDVAIDSDIIVTAQQAQKQVVSDGAVGVLGNKDALSTPFNVSSYTAQLVLDQQSETIGDVLENDPSVRTTYGSGNQSELFVIRGFALAGDDVSIDGLYGVTPRQIVSPELYESIQLLNGASAFLFGAAPGGSGIGGGINLTPKRAQRTLFRATASYGADSTFGGNADLGTRFGEEGAFGFRVNGVYRSGDTAVDNEHREVKVVGASFDLRKGPGRFFLDFGYEDQAASWSRPTVRLAANIAVPAAPRATYNYGQPWTFTKLRDIYALSRVELDIAKDWMIYAAAGFRDGAEKGDYSTLTIINANTGAGTGSRLYVPREDNNEAGQAGIRGKFATGGITNEFNAGGSVIYTENRNSFAFGNFPVTVRTGCGIAAATVSSFCTNLYSVPIVDKPALGTVGGSLSLLPRVALSELKSIFVSDTIGIVDERVLITVGARRQNLVVDAFNRATLARTTRYDRSATTPVVGVIVKPTDHLSFYANRIEGLAQGPVAPNNATTTNPGEVFAPFRSVQYEAGAKIAIKGLTGTLAVYQTRQPSSYNMPVAGSATLVTFVVDGEQRNRGLEVTLNGEPTSWIRFIGGFSINDAKITQSLNGLNNGKKAVGVPDYQVNFGAEFVPPFLNQATLTARVVRTGKQMINIPTTTALAQELPDWTRFDLGLRYVAVADRHPLTFRVSAENIADRRYWYSAFGGYLLQGSPRTVKASATFEY